ncbi:hypothetical protein THAOC_36372 [Thalassiosira oceanica]|uniref:DUF6743 domain-containing protein n=1 Tax=Thalassiosira oceanica TaxID=159749 RepID=K0R1Z0_THAOC|nr:hypothetical protein THAOC_36372 [Thalassiosira oceanica]|eukprot:EJK45039.1 hypothetical protein THAOC_36372 [Thalassiosira oceanica]
MRTSKEWMREDTWHFEVEVLRIYGRQELLSHSLAAHARFQTAPTSLMTLQTADVRRRIAFGARQVHCCVHRSCWSVVSGALVPRGTSKPLGTIQEVTTATGTDNTAAHSWATKGAVSSTGPSSYLLRLKSMHQRAHRAAVLEYFNRTYPQAIPWQIREFSPAMNEALNSALLCKRPPPEALDCLDVVLKPVDESDTGFPQGWELPVISAASHGFRQRLYEQFALRPKSWTDDRRPTPSSRKTPKTQMAVSSSIAAPQHTPASSCLSTLVIPIGSGGTPQTHVATSTTIAVPQYSPEILPF